MKLVFPTQDDFASRVMGSPSVVSRLLTPERIQLLPVREDAVKFARKHLGAAAISVCTICREKRGDEPVLIAVDATGWTRIWSFHNGAPS